MAESIGGYDYEFLEVLPDDLTCTLCHFAYKQPVQIEECGHKFCKECFNQMKDHNEANSLDLCCPLDREKINVTRVFKDKSDERRVFNLIVKCPNFGDKCDWTGELREALLHEKSCCKKEKMFTDAFVMELKQLDIRVTELESKVKTNEHQLVEKDMKITNQCKTIENLNKEIKDLGNQIKHQNKTIDNQNKQFKNQTKQLGDNQNKKVADLNKQIEDQNKQIEDQKIQIKVLQQSHKQMIIPNITDESRFSPISTAFQWKFDPTEIKSSCAIKFGPPIYNIINSYCFQLGVDFVDNNLHIILFRYRGKYDADAEDNVETTKEFNFCFNVFGKIGVTKVINCRNLNDYSIPKNAMRSKGWSYPINNDKIDDLTVDGCMHLHCFFL